MRLEIVKKLAATNPVFGYICDNSEFCASNMNYTKLGQNEMRSPVGTDLNKYVPGLYWSTILSKKILERHKIDLNTLLFHTNKYEVIYDELYLLIFYDGISEWKRHRERLDNLCANIQGIFSIREVNTETSNFKTSLRAGQSIDLTTLEEYYTIVNRWP